MQTQNRFFEDLAKLATGAAGTLAGVGREMEANMRQAFERMIGGMDLVSREEFEAVKAMAATARAEAEALKARLDALEGRSAVPTSADPTPKPAPKRSRGASRASPGDAKA
ncbi:accessory factor UbiK family protein [Sphingoaurantiacus capsulatus]|uniref:Accessory factor UbiK family protein n=1 Tax=Sphingoaurantiacus capsulatus TaxID=1771310 RepID=A0ABV7XCP5_9SPHN